MSEKRLAICEAERADIDAELARRKVNGSFRERKQSGANVGKFSPLRENSGESCELDFEAGVH